MEVTARPAQNIHPLKSLFPMENDWMSGTT